MISNQRNYYSIRILAISFSVLLIMLASFIFVGAQIIPKKLRTEVSQNCVRHLQDKSYQLKQTLLEHANNSKLWIENRDNTFFDSKWFAISYYEHDGREWVLKDFKMNDVVLDIYKIAQSEYIKVDQGLQSPHVYSQQITLQESKIADMPLLILDLPNSMPSLTSNNLIRITLFTDFFVSTLNSDKKCQLSMMDAKGNFLIPQQTVAQTQSLNEAEFLETLQNETQPSSVPEVALTKFESRDIFNYKVLKNLYLLAFTTPQSNAFLSAFIEIGIFNFLAVGIIILLCFYVLHQKFTARIQTVNSNIRRVSEKNFKLNFDLSNNDELTATELEVANVADELRRK